jgi:uncharacterized phage protein gp47/JayE
MRDLDVGYLGVIVDDRDPQALFDAMVASIQAADPGWEPHNGALEVLMLEAFAVAASDWIYATNRTVGALVESVLAQYGVARDDGAPAQGQLTLTFDGSVTTTITEGTEFVADDGTTLQVVRDTNVSGATAGVDVQEAEPGAGALLSVGDAVSPVVGIPRLSTCTLTTGLAGGRAAEDDLSYLTRTALHMQRSSTALTLPDTFTAFALGDPRVGRATTINRWNAATNAEVNGHVTVALYGRGAALPADVLAELTATITDATVSVLTVHVIAATRPTVNITAGITVGAGFDGAAIADQCEAVLAEWLGWNNVGFGQTITPDAIEAILTGVPGVTAAVCSAPGGDVTHSLWALPAPGTITVTV